MHEMNDLIFLFIVALLILVVGLALSPRKKPENYTHAVNMCHDVETRAEAEARAIIEQCWPDEVV